MRVAALAFCGLFFAAASDDGWNVLLEDNEVDELSKHAENRHFQAETEKLMRIIIDSMYTEKDVFLRELVSNAADALEKARLQQLKNRIDNLSELKITVAPNKARKIITITDNGIGMCKAELADNLGTVARSGTQSFLKTFKKAGEDHSLSNLIGQFGVGFYSAFLVADRVTVVSKCAQEKDQHIWWSDANGEYEIATHPRRPTISQGTTVILNLKESEMDYLNPSTLRKLLMKFSEFVPFPIYLESIKGDETKLDLINALKPIWLRDKSNVTEEEYSKFYTTISQDVSDPLLHTHFKTEGDIEFSALMYIPQRQSREMLRALTDDAESPSRIRLYVRRVLISDKLDEFLPSWIRFVSGVIDSDNLPLKVDRQTFTQSRVMRVIRAKVINKVFEALKTLSHEAEEEEISGKSGNETVALTKFNKFWDIFGQNLLLGCVDDPDNKNQQRKIVELFRVRSSKDPSKVTSMNQYISRMWKDQENIYIITGENLATIGESPALEFFNENGIEVLYLTGAFDEQCLMSLSAFKEKKFVSVEKNTFGPDEFAFLQSQEGHKDIREVRKELRREYEATKLYYKPLLDYAKDHLGILRVSDVLIARSLVKSAAIISAPEHGMTATHERVARTSLGQDNKILEMYARMKNLELNPKSALIHSLLKLAESGDNPKLLNRSLEVLYETGLISAGYAPKAPHLLTGLITKELSRRINPEQVDTETFNLTIPSLIYDEYDSSLQKEETLDEADNEEDDDLFDRHDEL